MISVLTPTYNRADKLHRVYESIKSQTLKKIDDKYIFEWIIVDDGSSDNTKELVKKWQNEAKWEIKYIYQENSGKWGALQRGLKEVKRELTLIADSDDRFLKDTFETFYNIWNNFSNEEKEKCIEIESLCQDQYENLIGREFVVSNQLVPTIQKYTKNLIIGEKWGILKTKNLKEVFLDINIDTKFIPESFFWDKMMLQNYYFYPINKVLRIYYKENSNISIGIRYKYPKGFFIESKYFIFNYYKMLFKAPKSYLKHFVKFIYFGFKLWFEDNKKNNKNKEFK